MDEVIKTQIEKRLKRKPNGLEKHLFEAMWSEHCGYLHSKKQLKKLNFKGALFPQENAGGVRVGRVGIFFKTESHNHPCAVEPYQGAATGVGGIIRDILALNARPVALLNSLKFAPPEDKAAKHIISGVTSGISDYGNSCGIPDIAGEVIFDDSYKDMPLVNVMAVGIAPLDRVKLSKAKANLEIVLLGSATGLDGIGGAAFASKELKEDKKEEKIHVQIGDPFAKKQLIEASLEILNLEGVIACQDCGAAGILSSTSEMAYKGDCTIELELAKVHLAQKNMEPWQILLSETQERMVFALKKEVIDKVFKIAQKYELEISHIGRTLECNREENLYIVKKDGKILSSTPVRVLCEPYCYELEAIEPGELKILRAKKCNANLDVVSAVEKMSQSYNLASKKWFYEQWDYLVGARSYVEPSYCGAGVLKLIDEEGFAGFCMDTNPLFCALDSYTGSVNTVLESYRNLVSSGFEPLGFTDCLNFANPGQDSVKYTFVKSVEGLKYASEALNVPVVSGNVSFYNEINGRKVHPSVTLGMCGYCKKEEDIIPARFLENSDIFLIGRRITKDSNIGGSLYQKELFGFLGGCVDMPDIELEIKLKNTIFYLRNNKLIEGAADVSKGGLLGTLMRVLFDSGTGFSGSLIFDNHCSAEHKLKLLFGEIGGRYLVCGKKCREAEKYFIKNNIPYLYLGKSIGDKIKFDGYEFELSKLKEKYLNSISNALDDV